MSVYNKIFIGVLVSPFVCAVYAFSIFWFLSRLFPSMGNVDLAFLTAFFSIAVLVLILHLLGEKWEI